MIKRNRIQRLINNKYFKVDTFAKEQLTAKIDVRFSTSKAIIEQSQVHRHRLYLGKVHYNTIQYKQKALVLQYPIIP